MDALPDGTHMIGLLNSVVQAQAEEGPQITVVLNWFDDVRERMR